MAARSSSLKPASGSGGRPSSAATPDSTGSTPSFFSSSDGRLGGFAALDMFARVVLAENV